MNLAATFPLLTRPDIVAFIQSPNAALDYQTSHAEPRSLLSRRDDTCQRMRSLGGLRPYEERAERPSVYVERMRRYNSQKQELRGSIISAAPRENIYAAARIDLHHSKGFMGLGQNRLPNRLNLGDALTKSGLPCVLGSTYHIYAG